MKIWSLILHIGMWCIASLFWHDRFQHQQCFQLVQDVSSIILMLCVGVAANVAIVFESNLYTVSLTLLNMCHALLHTHVLLWFLCPVHNFTAINKRFNTEVTCIPTKFITTLWSKPQHFFFLRQHCFFFLLLRRRLLLTYWLFGLVTCDCNFSIVFTFGVL